MRTESLKRVAEIIGGDRWCMATLAAVRLLDLPDWAIGAGFVRNRVWDHLSGYAGPTPLNDVDVLYFDPADVGRDREGAIERDLARRLPDRAWSVRNQARMHLRNKDAPYADTADAMAHWLETATAVAVRLEADDTLTVIAPFGVGDLLAMRSGPTTSGLARRGEYRARMVQKDWSAHWPCVKVRFPAD
jgi:hypothetical protein